MIHELRKLARPKKLLNRGHYGADINQRLGSDDVDILNGHPLLDHSLHAGETDAEGVLQELTHRAQAAVTEMIDIVDLAQPFK